MASLRRVGSSALLLSVALASARWTGEATVDAPLDQMEPNLVRRIQTDPRDSQAHYLLGRLHSVVYATGKEVVPVKRGTESGPAPEVSRFVYVYRPLPEGTAITPARLEHLRQSVLHFRTAAMLNPEEGLYRMGLGWALDEASRKAPHRFLPSAEATARAALIEYREAVRLQLEGDLKVRIQGPTPRFSREAAEAILRILDRYPRLAKPGEVKSIKGTIAKLDAQPMAVTPILIPLHGEETLTGLLDPAVETKFDLAGDGVGRSWPWLRRTTGILVWDPTREGRITSGRQLFGSSTWWMFFRDGYEALGTLDSDHDGWLRGGELRGIRVWTDENGNGKSDEGEVRDLSDLGISAISSRPDRREDQGPSSTAGVLWRDGSRSPTWDWCPREIRLPAGADRFDHRLGC